jgi:hypothetical protein
LRRLKTMQRRQLKVRRKRLFFASFALLLST